MLKELKGGSSSHHARTRRRRRQVAVRAIVSLIFLILVGIILAMAYVWYSGNTHKLETPAAPPVAKSPTTKPKVDENAPVGVAITTISPSVKPGSNASITIKTRPSAACSITVTYDKTKSTDAGLVPKTADEFGVVVWTWSIETNQPVGSWPVEVTCAYNSRSGYGKEILKVVAA